MVVSAIVHIFVEASKLGSVAKEIASLPETVDVYEVTGEYDIIAIVISQTIQEFRQLIAERILKIPGVKSTVTNIILHFYKKSGEIISD